MKRTSAIINFFTTMAEEITKENLQAEEAQGGSVNELDALKKERDEYLEGWKRAKADFANYKSDEMRRVDTILKLSNEQLIKELIVVLDSFDLAIESLQAQSTTVEKGVYLIRTQLEDVLKKFGLERVEVIVGKPFNPAFHEAVAMIESAEIESGSIIDEIEHGYMLAGKLIRAARVRVAK